MDEDVCRAQLFETARQRAEWSITDMWVGYLALGGVLDLFTIEAYLHGLAPLPPGQQDVLANAVNEHLEDLYQAAKVPYLHPVGSSDPPGEDPVALLADLLHGSETAGPTPDHDS